MNCCSWKPSIVKLHDGTEVLSDSEEWRHHCEALAVIKMPGQVARRAFLRGKVDDQGVLRGGVLQRRGEAACLKLEKTIKDIWYSDQGQAK